jgi:hypothetical protein
MTTDKKYENLINWNNKIAQTLFLSLLLTAQRKVLNLDLRNYRRVWQNAWDQLEIWH